MRISKEYVGMGSFAVGCFLFALTQKACDDKCRMNYQQKIQQADPARYQRLMAQKDKNYSGLWQQEYKKMQDSLRTDSFYRAGYNAGQQSVRDSLKQAEK